MKYLNFKVNIPTPFQFIGLILEILNIKHKELIERDLNLIYVICLKILECFYFESEKIYDRLHEHLTSRSRDSNEDRFIINLISNTVLIF